MSSRFRIDECAEVKSGSGLWGNDVIPFVARQPIQVDGRDSGDGAK